MLSIKICLTYTRKKFEMNKDLIWVPSCIEIQKNKKILRLGKLCWLQAWMLILREKCSNTEFFLVRIFLYSDWIRIQNTEFSPNTGKYGPEKTPYLDTFHAVWMYWNKIMIRILLTIVTTTTSATTTNNNCNENNGSYILDIYLKYYPYIAAQNLLKFYLNLLCICFVSFCFVNLGL